MAKKPLDPSLGRFHAMLAEEQAAIAARDAAADDYGDFDQRYKEAETRRFAAFDAIMACRPTDPAAIAAQLRWLLVDLRNSDVPADALGVIEHATDQLAAMEGRLMAGRAAA